MATVQAFELPEISGARRWQSGASSPLAEPLSWLEGTLSTSILVVLGVRLTGPELDFHQHKGLGPQSLYLSVSHCPTFRKGIVVNFVLKKEEEEEAMVEPVIGLL